MTSKFRYVMYMRKSQERDDRQALSLPAQERELIELAQRQGISKTELSISESMSAKTPGRPGFAKMLDQLQRGRAEGIICWHLDRLARNPLDGGALMWALGQGVIKEIVTPGRTYTGTGDDKLMMTGLLVDGVLAETDYAGKRDNLVRELAKLDERLSANRGEAGDLEPLESAFILAKNAKQRFESAVAEDKRALVQAFVSNLELSDRKLSVFAKKPFCFFGELGRISGWLRLLDEVRTYCAGTPTPVSTVLSNSTL